jgi:hypothetical protein
MATYREACFCPVDREPTPYKQGPREKSDSNRKSSSGRDGKSGGDGGTRTKDGGYDPNKKQNICNDGLCGKKGKKGNATKK